MSELDELAAGIGADSQEAQAVTARVGGAQQMASDLAGRFDGLGGVAVAAAARSCAVELETASGALQGMGDKLTAAQSHVSAAVQR